MKPETEKVLKGIAVVAGVLGVAYFASKVQAKPCTPGETKCIGYDLLECSSDGTWVVLEANSPTCGWEPGEAEFVLSGLVIDPSQVYVGEKVLVSIGSVDVTLGVGNSEVVTFEIIPQEPGTYPVTVNGLTGSFTAYAVPECTEGETKCVGYDLYSCVNSTWVLQEQNSPQCDYIPPVCTDGETKCVGYSLYECVSGEWVLIEENSPECGWEPPQEISMQIANPPPGATHWKFTLSNGVARSSQATPVTETAYLDIPVPAELRCVYAFTLDYSIWEEWWAPHPPPVIDSYGLYEFDWATGALT